MRTRKLLLAVAGPGAFALAARVGGRMEPGYVPRDEPISALAAHGTRSAPVMVPGFLGLAAGSIALARELRGSRFAPQPVPALLGLAGLTVAGAGLARCSDRTCPTRWLGDDNAQRTDDLHAYFSAATFALWIAIPLVAAARVSDAPAGYRSWSRRFAATTFVTLMAGGMLARNPDAKWGGTAQRVMLASAFAWYPLAALALVGE
jgi:Protein of unknown function (DUF998)